MRIHISTTKNTSLVPFNYQQKLVGTIHKWIGENSIHDKIEYIAKRIPLIALK